MADFEVKQVDKWCWAEDGMCVAHGPFDTRDEAIKDARRFECEMYRSEANIEIIIGYPAYANALSYLPSANTFIETIEQNAYDNEFGHHDDMIFDVSGNCGEAEKELEAALKAWAEKYLSSTCWYLVELERVTI